MDEEAAKVRTEWEDNIRRFFDGTRLEVDLMCLKYLRLRHPNQSTQLSELERDIERERRKNAG